MSDLKTVEIKQGKKEVSVTLDLTGVFIGVTLNVHKRTFLNKGTDAEVQISGETISDAVNINLQNEEGITDLSVLDLAKAIKEGFEKVKASQAL